MTHTQFADLIRNIRSFAPVPIYTDLLSLGASGSPVALNKASWGASAKVVKIMVCFNGAGAVYLGGGVIAATSASGDSVVQIDAPAGSYFAGNEEIDWSGLVDSISVSYRVN